MARDVHELVRTLGHDRVDLVGSDIGAMVAYSFAANHPDATGRVALLDVAHPEEGMYQLSLLPLPDQPFHLWWFAFNQVRELPEQLLTGRSRFLVDWLCDQILVNPNSVSDLDRAVYANAYSYPDAIRAGNGWYQTFAQDIADERGYRPVTAPLLALAAEGNYPYLRELLPTKATDVEVVKVDDTGHYIVEEQPDAVVKRLTDFLTT